MQTYTVSGLMSGSSLDGVDLAFCEFFKEGSGWDFRIVFAETIPYPHDLKNSLLDPFGLDKNEVRELDLRLGKYYAELINRFHKKHRVQPDLIASHGHTLFHEPENGLTFQAGHGPSMAELTGITLINDFRSEDLANGGQGAPLVPIGDLLLFGKYDACLNLGGFANISFDQPDGKRIAFDVGPANLALNHIASREGLDYDRDGIIASRGSINSILLKKLNALDYYQKKAPKSLGKEWFREVFHPLIKTSELSIEDLMATMVEHIAIQLASVINLACADNVLVSGGGAMNKVLMERFAYHTGAQIFIPAPELINFKEALIFAFLGLLRLRGEINCLSSVTGGASDLSTGVIHKPSNK